MDKFSYVGNADVNAIEALYKEYKKDPSSVDETWGRFFEGFDFARTDFESGGVPENFQKEFKVINLIDGYRSRGHLFTRTNPVRERRKYEPTLAIENFGLEQSDLDTVFQAGQEIGIGPATLRDIIKHLEETYCESIGIEYVYMREPERLNWFRNRIEVENRYKFSKETKLEVFETLSKATLFEQFLQKKFVGQKRFSVEGGESLIAGLDALSQFGAQKGVEEIVIGMAHRGRLNTLANIFKKEPRIIFSEFEGRKFDADESFDGDVKYHLGHSLDVDVNGRNVHMTLAPNPSHLEAVDPVVEGIARSKIEQRGGNQDQVLPILIHGDAAIAAQGVVYETVQMAGLKGYGTGGTIHIVVNNQVGFTTNYIDARSSTYCTDVGKTTLCPVFHVNGDDVEAMIQTIQMAMDYRQKFHRDVFIDLLCYRKYGHNEGDEPKFTQPALYDKIKKHPNPRDIYMQQLMKEGILDKATADKVESDFIKFLDHELEVAKEGDRHKISNFLKGEGADLLPATDMDVHLQPDTTVDKEVLKDLGRRLATLPEGKKYFRKVQKLMDDRVKMLEDDRLDWGMGEMLAYASLLVEGHSVRISGQDVERGTFSHRHAVVKTEDTEEEVITLNMLSKDQAPFSIYNSLLSEYAVLGFDYGYSLARPEGLTIWEAQFGDFFNGAQIMIDQFITAGEDKWNVQSGLVMLLPHGYEGMGAEHSSGRIERFLQMCAEHNIIVANCTTPANHFHLLRRQLMRSFRKPLVVFSPKMLLRYPDATSSLDEFSNFNFRPVLDDPDANPDNVDTVVFCSGKVYYEAKKKAAQSGVTRMAFVRLEQLYPLPQKEVDAILNNYSKAKRHIWLQEEPRNMGAWSFMKLNMENADLEFIGRSASSAPAAGSVERHLKRHDAMFQELFQEKNVKAKKA